VPAIHAETLHHLVVMIAAYHLLQPVIRSSCG
jgi:hypothetical protein